MREFSRQRRERNPARRFQRVHHLVSYHHAYGTLPYLTFSSSSSAHKVYIIKNLADEEATLIEPAACAVHGMDKLGTAVGIDALVIGAGPTGLVLAQLLKLNGATKVVIAANKGIKTELAQQLQAADEYVELDRQSPDAQWEQLKKDNPYGFDVVVRASTPRHHRQWMTDVGLVQVEATGSEKIANEAINYVRRGGKLMVYGVYDNAARVHWSPAKIFQDEIQVRPLPLPLTHGGCEG